MCVIKLKTLFNRNSELWLMVGTAFDSKVASLIRLRKKNLIVLQIINKQINSIKPDPPFCFVGF